VIEGPTLVADAVAAGVDIETIYAEPGTSLPRGVEAVLVEPGTLAAVTDAVTSQGVAAVARLPQVSLDTVDRDAPILVCVAVGDPGNAGTLLRGAEAAGFGAVLFTAGSVDPFAPKCVRASAGSVFRLAVVRGGEASTVLDEVAATGRRRIGTRMHDAPAHSEADLRGPLALVVGNEAHGLPADLGPHIDDWVSIPMAGRAESLNVAMAGTLLCFEVLRRG
jgi:TrmH family RNA methyltransferase